MVKIITPKIASYYRSGDICSVIIEKQKNLKMKRKFKEYQIEGFDPGCIKDNDVVEIMEEYRKAYVKAREYAASKFQIGNFSFDTLEFDGDIDGYNEAKEQYLFDNGIEETKDYIKTKIGNVSWKHLRDYHAYDNGPCAGSVYEITVEIF